VGRSEIIIEIPDQKTLFLYADDEQSHSTWMDALQQAASRKFEVFYNLGRDIGRGPYTKVRAATHKKTCKLFAAKMVDKRIHRVSYVEMELKSMRVVDHPNLVPVVDCFDTKERIYVISEFMKGGTLYQTIARNAERYTEETACKVMKEIFKAVLALHQEGYYHRNIKPSNLLCWSSSYPETVKLADYGWISFFEKACENDEYFENDTKIRALIVAPHFTAPEILYGSSGFGKEVDLWSCGVILYSILTGTLPFSGKSRKEVVSSIKDNSQGPPFRRAEWSVISPEARDLVGNLLKVDPQERITVADALAHPWITMEKTSSPVIRNNFSSLLQIPSFVLPMSQPSKLYSVDSAASQTSAEGTFTISSETRRLMTVTKSKLMYSGDAPHPSQFHSIDGAAGPIDERRISHGLSRSSRSMNRLSRGLRKNATLNLFTRRNSDGPSEYW